MPIYVYRCDSCGSELEVRQSFSDAPLTECEKCHGALRKVLSPAVVIFKGSGFYVTDNNSKSGANGRNGSAEKTESGEKNGSNESASKAEAKSEAASAGASKQAEKAASVSES